MKKLLIYMRNGSYNKEGEENKDLLRTVQIHPTFVGIGKWGQVNHYEFKRLAEILEPSMTSYEVISL